MRRPPRLAEILLRLSAPAKVRNVQTGDLAEEFYAHAEDHGTRRARLWYWGEVLKSVPPNLAQRLRLNGHRRNRRHRGDHVMQTLLYDLKYSLRGLRKSLGFSVVVVLTLSAGIGANTLVYSIVDGVILHPFPFPEPDRLVGIGTEWPRLNRELGFWETMSPPEYLDIVEQSETMEHIVMWDMNYLGVSIEGGGPAESLLSGIWFADVFPALQMAPAIGRGFLREEIERGDRVAILSHRFWQTRLGADSAALGEPVFVDGEPYTLVGVMPPKAMIYASDLWIPMGTSPERFARNRRQMQMIARIKAGHDLQAVNTELETISRRIDLEYGAEFEEYGGWRMRALPWSDVNVRLVKPAAFALLAAVGFVLLIVCANVASLLLARSAARSREIAVRTALGASRKQIVRQLLTESILLSGFAGAVGVGITFVAVPILNSAIPAGLPVAIDLSVNLRVLSFTALISIVAGLVFGLAPAFQGSVSNVQETLKTESTSSTGNAGRHRLQRAFVGAEVAVALLLLIQSGLFVNSFVRMQGVSPGFDTGNTLTMRLTLPPSKYRGAQITTFFQQLVERVEGLPGVQRAGAGTQYAPMTFGRSRFAVEGQQYQSDEGLPVAYMTQVSDGYFEAFGIPLKSGRSFTTSDTPATPLVAVINDAAARRFFPTDNPIGKRVKRGGADSESPWVEIVGVVGSVHNRGLSQDPQPEFFANIRQLEGGSNQLFLIVRTVDDPYQVLPAIQTVVAALDPDQPVYAIATVAEVFRLMGAPRRYGTLALMVFALFATCLAAAGIYSVVSHGVGERTREIGIRMALGAHGAAVRNLVVRQAMWPVMIGGVVGLGLAVALGLATSSLLFNVAGTDPVTVIATTVVLLGVALAASYVPARRASRLDPTLALRRE